MYHSDIAGNKPHLFTLIIVAVLPDPFIYTQRPCDTLICVDGRRIPAQILHSKAGFIYDYNCSDFIKTEQKIASSTVTGFAPFVRKESEGNQSYPSNRLQRTATERWFHCHCRFIPGRFPGVQR